MKVRFSEQALRDLEGIADFIAQDNPRRAVSFVTEIHQACSRLVDAPRGHPLIEHPSGDIRRAVYKPYSIFYMLDGEDVLIDRILHGARDIGPDLFGV
jgi:toxin ParE1/3/4